MKAKNPPIYADWSPIYSFHTSFPSSGVHAIKEGDADPKVAYQMGLEYLRDYKSADPYGNMGECLGVTERDGCYYAVINTYHSNT